MIYRLKEAGGYPTRTIFDTCGTSQEKSSCSTRNYSWIYFLRRNPFSANPQRQLLKRIREISVVIFSKQWKPCWKPLYEEESKEKKRLKKPCICVLWLYQLSNFARKVYIIRYTYLLLENWTYSTDFLKMFSKKHINFLWMCWFEGKNLSNLVSLSWKLHNPTIMCA